MQAQLLLLPFISFVITILNIPGLRFIATQVGLVDKPNFRKVHQKAIPLVGGVSIFTSTVLTVFASLAYNDLKIYSEIFVCTLILHVMGIIDDRYDIKASLKLIIQIALAHYMYMQGVKIESFHGLFGVFELPKYMQYFLTIIVITGVVNAFNLMDGIDGLAAGLSAVSFTVFAILSYLVGNEIFMMVFTTLTGATLAFLYYNLSNHTKVFMGDAGSLMIGFILAISGITLLQSPNKNIAETHIMLGVTFVFVIPVFDALRVFRKRIKAGKSPFSADRSHLHHLVLSIGLKHKKAAALIVMLKIALMITGFLLYSFAGITVSILISILIFALLSYGLQLNDQINLWKAKIKNMEQSEIR
jgi:UDP-GlcNAc:undecaprenyl-phosphate/decaprenyl-phosphate GlcNAc-1-phosphate transferase